MAVRPLRGSGVVFREWIARVFWVIVAAILVTLVLWWEFRSPLDPLTQQQVAQACRTDYAKARTPAESVSVDRESPVLDRTTAVVRMTCGELRRTGKLR